jgi:DNA polymerase-3 subunit alpha
MWLLCLKAHWAEEFYASILSCETLTDKIKEYKMEAKLHNVHMERLNINKSNVSFDLQGDKIYYGFSNIKGIGEEPAKRIVENQPYSSFEDFLNKLERTQVF